MSQGRTFMRAAVIENIGGPRALKSRRFPRPQPTRGEALVKIHAASVNASDLLYRSGKLVLRKPMPHILGADLAGEIVEIGEDAGDWAVGDRVATAFAQLGYERDGGYAEYCSVPATELVKLPGGLAYPDAVAAGASFSRAWLALVLTGKLKKADRVVIHSAASDIGRAAVQIASARGAQVIAISAGQFAANLRAIGASTVLEDAGNDLPRQVQVATGEQGATLVLRPVATRVLSQSIEMLESQGRLVIAGALPKQNPRLNIMDIYRKSLSLLGSSDSIQAKDFASILQAVEKSRYKPLIDEVLPLSRARQAHSKLERNPPFGKIVLAPDSILEAAKKPDSWVPIE